MKFLLLCILNYTLITVSVNAQIENLTIYHPVYDFLRQIENKGILEHKSLSDLPLSRQEIIEALDVANNNIDKLSKSEKKTLDIFLKEFYLIHNENSVLFYSESDNNQLFFKDLFSDNEKLIFRLKDSVKTINIIPLADVDFKSTLASDVDQSFLIANLGARVYGTISNRVGYNLQVTNGSIFSGERNFAMEVPKYGRNVKFSELNSDADITESHVNFKYKWFEAGIGREYRIMGAGLNQSLFIGSSAPAFDAIWLSANFNNFEYKFMHGSLLALPEESVNTWGFNVYIPSKYVAIHRFSLKPSWGEIAFWENVVYSNREPDLAYLNPLSFFKSVEHSLRDRDNSVMGLDATFRIFNRLQIKGSYLLDDIIFSKIGTGFWSNKSAWNVAIISDLSGGIFAGFEYSRIEPYTFSHFNYQNSMTHDGLLYGSNYLPNSESFSALINWWWGGRYPLKLNATYTRHGRNVFDENGNLIKNVGGDPLQTRRPEDPLSVIFLDGDMHEIFLLELSTGIELTRALNFHPILTLKNENGINEMAFRLLLRIYDF